MKKTTLKNLTHAHAWLGLIISGVLMIVFVCGSLSFFRENIVLWDMQYDAPHTQVTEDSELIPVSNIAKQITAQGHTFPDDHGVFIELPTKEQPYYVSYFEIETPEGKHVDIEQSFDPYTGEILSLDQSNYYLGHMLYRMHLNLMFPTGGTELVGIVSLLFFVMVLTGCLIVLKKIISHYYQYRTNRNKDLYLDGHTMIGVSALPFTFIYALTGVMFNLSIILQAGFGFAVFKGNIPALMETADFYSPPRITELANAPSDLARIDEIMADAKQRHPDKKVYFVNLFVPNDANAQLEVALTQPLSFERVTRLTYQVNTATLLQEYVPSQSATAGTYDVLSTLHTAEFGSNIMKFVYFILGLGCCYLILTGNLIWITKREQQRQQSQRGLQFVKAMTLALSSGTLIAVASCFIAARFAPQSWSQVSLQPSLFGIMIALCLIHGWFSKPARNAMMQQLSLAGLLFIINPIYDLVQWLSGHVTPHYLTADVLLVNSALLVICGFCWLLVQHHRAPVQAFEGTPATQS
ncbi:hypothetical protein PULV_a2298 [Pseudoalteromonas ulvae UL12]|uniref:PepSY-associated TM helix domain-containing protein n=1 Tax=Pseudoalteromonas ulvae TaxID=107327 RepID=UPI00186B87C3|nr:PepSY-associated TM helix domain-containing protein [Pseudoalteromonas ulvae]MBE0364578.1 hypothetical protein [Pseudoalteromonas ulvae UL12]